MAQKRMKWIIICITALSISTGAKVRFSHFVLPSDTDSLISHSRSPHYIVLNRDVAAINKLLVFLPGTGSFPYAYRYFAWAAADMGYHAINLSYCNEKFVNLSCTDKSDAVCHEKIRKEIITGIDLSPLVDVNSNESIINRLIRLLVYLDNYFPEDSWGQYIDKSGKKPAWQSIAWAGHSQGGGHSAMIGKMYEVDRVIMFSSADFVKNRKDAPAIWLSKPGKTAINRYFAMGHTSDRAFPLKVQRSVWKVLGLYTIGPEMFVDTVLPPYRNSHILITSRLPAREAPCETPFHNSVIADNETPKDKSGNPLFLPAWQYLLSGNDVFSVKER